MQQEENGDEISSEGEEDGEKMTKDAVPEEEEEGKKEMKEKEKEKDDGGKTADEVTDSEKERWAKGVDYLERWVRRGRRFADDHARPFTTTGVNHWGPSGLCNENLNSSGSVDAEIESKPPTEWDLNQSSDSPMEGEGDIDPESQEQSNHQEDGDGGTKVTKIIKKKQPPDSLDELYDIFLKNEATPFKKEIEDSTLTPGVFVPKTPSDSPTDTNPNPNPEPQSNLEKAAMTFYRSRVRGLKQPSDSPEASTIHGPEGDSEEERRERKALLDSLLFGTHKQEDPATGTLISKPEQGPNMDSTPKQNSTTPPNSSPNA